MLELCFVFFHFLPSRATKLVTFSSLECSQIQYFKARFSLRDFKTEIYLYNRPTKINSGKES